jgi:CheY-like chemotaxis protein
VSQILVIDDDPSGTQLLIDLLRFAGHRGYALENWQDPVAGVEETRPDLVIMDVRLRVHDGLDLLRGLRAHPDAVIAGTPVLMTSAENLSAQCRTAGATGFLEKPFDTACLFRTIQEIVEVGVSEN